LQKAGRWTVATTLHNTARQQRRPQCLCSDCSRSRFLCASML